MPYNTKQRTVIFNYIKEHKQHHITAHDVIEAVRPYGVGSATVYRYLERFVREGQLRKFSGNEKEGYCYQYAENGQTCSNHYHFLCEQCGKYFHVECGHIDEMNNHFTNEHGFDINLSKTVFLGVCSECKEKEGTEK